MIVLLISLSFAGVVWMSQAYHNNAWPFLPYDWEILYEKKTTFLPPFSTKTEDTLYILQYSKARNAYRIKWFGYQPQRPYDSDAYYDCLNFQLKHTPTSAV